MLERSVLVMPSVSAQEEEVGVWDTSGLPASLCRRVLMLSRVMPASVVGSDSGGWCDVDAADVGGSSACRDGKRLWKRSKAHFSCRSYCETKMSPVRERLGIYQITFYKTQTKEEFSMFIVCSTTQFLSS